MRGPGRIATAVAVAAVLLLPALAAGLPTPVLPVHTVRAEASDPGAGDRFGAGIALHGPVALVAAPWDDAPAEDAGSVRVMERVGAGAWIERARLTAPDASRGDVFGAGVAFDGTTAVVGAPLDDVAAPKQGSAHVFARSPVGTWQHVTQLVAPDGERLDLFGTAVAVDGDTIAVGASEHDAPADRSGAVYVYHRTDDGWQLEQKLNHPAPADQDRFGRSVALTGDRLVVGAPRDDVGGVSGAGSVHVFLRTGAGWTHEAMLVSPHPDGTAWFGFALDADGTAVLAGSPLEDGPPGEETGSADVFRRVDGSWRHEAVLSPAVFADHTRFGASVALAGETAIVGRPNDDVQARNAGAAHVFHRIAPGAVPPPPDPAPVWIEQSRLVARNAAPGDHLGGVVAFEGGVVLAGAPHVDVDGKRDAGAFYAYPGVGVGV